MLFPNFEKKTRKKNKIVNFPTKMKEIIEGALIIPNMVHGVVNVLPRLQSERFESKGDEGCTCVLVTLEP